MSKPEPALLVPSENWAGIQETVFLLLLPGMRESIKAGMSESVDACALDLEG